MQLDAAAAPPGPPPEPPREPLGQPRRGWRSLRLWFNTLLLVVVAVGLWQATDAAVRGLGRSRDETDRRVAELRREAAELYPGDPAASAAATAKADRLEAARPELAKVRWSWLAAAMLCAAIGILPPGLYWAWTLRSLNIRVPAGVIARAYYVGNLGKYVPGKAMVLVMRATALRPYGAGIPLTTVSVFVETLTTMAVAAAIGTAIITALEVPAWLRYLSLAAALAAVVPTLPPLFVPVLSSRLPPTHPLRRELPQDYRWGLMFKGWALSAASWLVLGTGLYCVVRGLPFAEFDAALGTKAWAMCVAASALSVVAGFVSLLPGGAGVRELVLTLLLSPLVGPASALVVAVTHRLVTILGELLLAAAGAAAAVGSPQPDGQPVAPPHNGRA